MITRQLKRSRPVLAQTRLRGLVVSDLVGHYRPLTCASPLRLIGRTTSPRPRVPFLVEDSALSRQLLLQRRIARVLSTENKQYVKEQTLLGVKLCIAALIVVNLAGYALVAYGDEQVEKRRPSPPDWTYLTRTAWRAALDEVERNEQRGAHADPGKVGNFWLTCLRRLEDTSIDGKSLKEVNIEGGEAFGTVRDIRTVAFDVTTKSEEWKAGYVEVILELGRIAECTQHLVYDRSQGEFFPETTVVGPSNPRPRKLPQGVVPPNEADCVHGMPNPTVLYNKVICAIGFNPKQRIEALHALANWQHFCKDEAAADECYNSALDIAQRAWSPVPSPATEGRLPSKPDLATLNIAVAYTQQASHLARTQRVSEALPIFLSCLQAVRVASSTAAPADIAPDISTPLESSGVFSDLSRKLFREDTYPLPQYTGNEPLSSVPSNLLKCTEAELMLYIGEILFATSAEKQQSGLAWTRDAAELAAGVLERTARMTGLQRRDYERCKQCLAAAVGNWDTMAALLTEKAERDADGIQTSTGQRSWFSGAPDTQSRIVEAKEQSSAVQALKTVLIGKGVVDASVFVPRGP
ncbi:hypothetical protein ANO11243_084270 [Dothideomycetidae sp. 11243]|nr:hypothetical protein ANO11243_084270 [fungal sp. No.11243]